MFVPGLNLDGTLKKRSTMQDRLDKEGQPGVYSPRVPSKSGSGERTAGGHADPTPRSRSVSQDDTAAGATSLNNSQSGTASEDGLSTVPIADPELERPRLSHSVGPPSGPRGSAPSALATLVEHQQAREKSPSVSGGATPEAELASDVREPAPPASRGTTTTSTTAPASVGRAGLVAPPPRPTATRTLQHVQLAGAYVVGRPLEDYVSLLEKKVASQKGRQGTSGATADAVASTTSTAVFRQNPMEYISSMAVGGDLLAVGDRAGRVCVLRRRAMTAAQRQEVAQLEEVESGSDKEEDDSPLPTRTAAPSRRPRRGSLFKAHPHSQDPYEFHTSKQAYVSVIDPLNSVDVLPNVTALAFLPQRSPASFLLTANEKVPKLYKIMTVRESAQPFRAVDKIDIKTIGPLTASSRASTVVMKPIVRYALNHEYNINSICPFSDCEQFVTADDLSVQLWCTEYPETSIETYDLRPPNEEEAREVIRGVHCFPHEPFLLFVMTSAGNARVVDVRQSMRWMDQTPQVFANPQRAADGDYSHVTNSLCDCALSPCGRYIAGRDFMSVCLWDVRMAGSTQASRGGPGSPRRTGGGGGGGVSSSEHAAVRNWSLHPHLRSRLESLYQSDLLFDRFDVAFVAANTVATGGFGNALYTIDVTRDGNAIGDTLASSDPEATASPGVQVFQLPSVDGASEVPRSIVRPQKASDSRTSTEASTTELGSRLTLLSRPTMSVGGACSMMACCGQAVLQLNYNGLF